MNSDKLNNINFLIDEELPLGHLQRFEKKLDRKLFHSNKSIKLNSIAAAIIILFIASYTIIYKQVDLKQTNQLLLANYSSEQSEVEKYYYSSLQYKIKTINHKNKMTSELTTELKEFNETIENLGGDMKINPHDERLVDALFGVYEAQLDALDNIIEQNN